MRCFTVDLQKEYPLQGGTLECILGDCPLDGENPQWKRPAVIVVPGGGYAMCSKREGEPIASFFLGKSFQTFILTYQTCTDGVRYPEQLMELASAVDYVRRNAQEFSVDPRAVFVVGFSAGGHLTANLAVDHAMAQPLDCRPTAVGLSYPVISTKTGYSGSHENLLSGYTQQEQQHYMQRLELDEQVNADTPPAFLWATATDGFVPAENALRFALAMEKQGILYELHIYPQGVHGGSTWAPEITQNYPPDTPFLKKNAQWLENCADFFMELIPE